MFKDRLVKVIEEKGLSRYKIAKETKITEATLSNYCNGKVNPSPSIVMQLANYLEIDFNWLITGNESSKISEPKEKYTILSKMKLTNKEYSSVILHLEKQIEEKDKIIAKLTHIIEERLNNLSK